MKDNNEMCSSERQLTLSLYAFYRFCQEFNSILSIVCIFSWTLIATFWSTREYLTVYLSHNTRYIAIVFIETCSFSSRNLHMEQTKYAHKTPKRSDQNKKRENVLNQTKCERDKMVHRVACERMSQRI